MTSPTPKGARNILSGHAPRGDRSYDTKLYRLRKARGIPAHVPGDMVRRHIDMLMSKGLSVSMIARAAGCSDTTIKDLLSGGNERMLLRTGTAILGVTHIPHPHQAHVPSIGTVRRIRALGTLGWSRQDLADRLGVSFSAVGNYTCSKLVTYGNWAKVRDLYDELSHIPGPSGHARRRSMAEGNPAPLDWEGLDIDDPHVTPKPATRQRKKAS